MIHINLANPLVSPDKESLSPALAGKYNDWPGGTFKLPWGHLAIYGSGPIQFTRSFPVPIAGDPIMMPLSLGELSLSLNESKMRLQHWYISTAFVPSPRVISNFLNRVIDAQHLRRLLYHRRGQ